jgi:chromate transporter
MPPELHLDALNWLQVFGHYLSLSLLTVGGAIATAPEMHRYLVSKQGWLSDSQFNSSIAIAQSAPGPNVLFVALMGWNLGLNAGSYWLALLGMCLALGGIMLPSSLLTYWTSRWSHANREVRGVRAFKLGLAPVVVALMCSTGWLLASVYREPHDWPLWLTTVITTMLVVHTRIHILWLLGAGAALGALGVI